MTSSTIKKLDNSEIEITGSIPAEIFDSFKERAIKSLGGKREIQGFRKGHIPEKILIEKLGESAVLQETAQFAISEEYPKIILEKKLDVIGRPEITITKLADGNPLEFKAKTAILPKFELPDYKSIAKDTMSEKDDLEVQESEVDDVLFEMRRRKKMEEQQKDLNGGSLKPEEQEKNLDETLPELNNEFAKSLGDFKDLNDLKTKIKEGLTEEKKYKNKDKKRMKVLESISEKIKISIPQILISNELASMMADLKGRIEQSGLDFTHYLKHIKKTEEELKESWKEMAKKRVIINLILNKIAKVEKIKPDPERVEEQAQTILSTHKDANKDGVRHYVENILTYEKVYELLEQ
jgi:trigger factor